MNVTVHYHAFLREKLGCESELLALHGAHPKVATLLGAFLAAHPEFERLASALNFAVNNEIVDRGAPVMAGDRVDVLPPYGGG